MPHPPTHVTTSAGPDNSQACSKGFPAWLFLLGVLIAIGPLSIDMYLPGFPAMAREFAHLPGQPEYTLASFFIGMALGQLAYGPLSDRFGRKPPLYVGLALYTVASLACALAGSLVALIGWRFVEALGACAGIVITRAVIRDRCGVRDSARAFSMLMLVMGVAPILAPLVGGWVVTGLGWRAVFWILTLFGGLCLLAIHFGLKESHDTRHVPPLDWRQVGRNYAYLLNERLFMGYTFASGLAMAALFAFIAGSPHVMINLYGLPTEHYGLAFGLNAGAFILASQFNARLLKRRPPSFLLHLSLRALAISALCLFILGLIGTPPFVALLAILVFTTACLGFIVPNATASALATHGQLAGTASALMGALQFGLATLASTAMGISQGNTVAALTWIMAICAFAAWLSHHMLIQKAVGQTRTEQTAKPP